MEIVNCIHVLPVNDLREHLCSLTCWCHPVEDTENECIVVHNAMDQREEYEEGRKCFH